MSLLAVDIGSSACKAVVFAASGQVLASAAASYTADFPHPAHAEMDAAKFFEAVCACTQQVARELSDPVRAVCFSSHGETFVPVNARGEAVGPAILNMDGRATSEAAWIEGVFGRKKLYEITGQVAHPSYTILKILWLREHWPEVFAATTRFASVTDYVLLQLGLSSYIDYSLASRFLAFDIRARRWSQEILTAVDLREERLPTPVAAGTVAGTLSASAAGRLGLPAGVTVIVGGHDQPCGALGTGTLDPGQVMDSIGTYECVLAATKTPSLTDAALAASLNTYCHVVPERYITIAYFPSGIMMKWFHDLLYGNGSATQEGQSGGESDHYAFLEANAPSGPTDLCVTPHLIGTCNPDFDPGARGVIAGLNPRTDRAHIYKGILEGVACELSQMTDMLAKAVGEFQDVRVIGGGARSALGLKLRAALTGCRLHEMQCQEAVCLGGAILAGLAIGEFGSIREAVDRVVHEAQTVNPDRAIATSYARQVRQYGVVRRALSAIHDS
jgi:xylulokinase